MTDDEFDRIYRSEMEKHSVGAWPRPHDADDGHRHLWQKESTKPKPGLLGGLVWPVRCLKCGASTWLRVEEVRE